MEYQPVQVSQPLHISGKLSAESRYWRSFKHPLFVKEYAPITSVHFAPTRPHRYAVTVGTVVQVYTPRVQRVSKTISRFKDTARSGCIRTDGKLLAAADDTGLVQLFDLNSRAILRTLEGHRLPTHHLSFSPLEQTQLLSASDDTTVRLWDIPSQSALVTFSEHSDYVRTGEISPSNPNIVVSGSYDRTVRLFDARSGKCEMVMGGGDLFEPVERVCMYPSATLLLSVSGPILRCWDLVAGGRCLRAMSNHQKTITSLCLTSGAKRILTGSLDRLVKVYDAETYNVIHTMRYPAPVLCLAISPDFSHIVTGMTDGTLSIRRKQQKPSEAVDSAQAIPSGSKLGPIPEIGERRLAKPTSNQITTNDDKELRVEKRRAQKLKPYDRLLKSFKYSSALDSVLVKSTPPSVTFALLKELIHADALHLALAGRDDILLEPTLRLLLKHVTDPRFGQVCCEVAQLVLDMYSNFLGHSSVINRLVSQLRRKVADELRFQIELMRVKGALDMIMTSSMLSNQPLPTTNIR